jgi:hypothetical protein
MARATKKKAAPADTANILAAPGALEGGEKVENFAEDETSELYKEAAALYAPVQRAYENKQEQADRIEEHWNIFLCKADSNQTYSGNSQCYVPAVRDCINARAKRTLAQLFPTKHKHVEAVGADREIPYAQLALIEHDIRMTRLKEIVRSDLVAGDVTGQWNLYIDWTRSYRRITELVKRNPELETLEGESVPLVDPNEEEDALDESDLLEEGPEIVDFATEDLAVVPPTCNDIEKAEAVAIRLRMSKDKVQELVEQGVFTLGKHANADTLWKALETDSQAGGNLPGQNPARKRAQDAGIKTEGAYKFLLCYEVTAKLDFPQEDGPPVKRLAYIYYASANLVLGIVKAPQWGGKRPVISAPVERVKGSFFGASKIEPVKFMQWNLNDYWNMGQDAAMYSLLPIWAADPLNNPNWASMVMGLAAVWPIAPNDVAPLTQPQLYKEALTICDSIKRQIWESMDVNEVMMGRMPQGRKNNATMGAVQQEQMTNIMDHAERYEECMLTPVVERMHEYERQFRTNSVLVEQRGEIGLKAKLTQVNPSQFGERYRYQWAGTSIIKGQQLQQMRIAGMNVLRGIPPQLLGGKRLDVGPILESFVEDLYGPELAPQILVDETNRFTVPPDVENEMMHNNLPVSVHPADDDQQHLISHMSGARLTGDANGRFRAHIALHTMALQTKMQTQLAQQQGMPGVPGGGQPGAGVPGTPRPGAQPGVKSGPQNPPGLPGPDQGVGPSRG